MCDGGGSIVSSRGREPDFDDEWEEERPRSRSRGGGGRRPPPAPVRTFGLPIVIAALAVGLFIGFIASCGGGGTKTVTETQTVTAPEAAATPGAAVPSGPASRATITLAFLNGSGEAGLAASRADAARTLGYVNIETDDAPSSVSADRVVYRRGAAARAAQVAQDLGLGAPTLLAAGDPVLSVAEGSAVIVLLGPSSGTSSTPDTGTTPDPGTVTASE